MIRSITGTIEKAGHHQQVINAKKMYNKLVYKIDIIDIELSLLTVCVVQLIYTLNDYDVRDDDLCISRPLMM